LPPAIPQGVVHHASLGSPLKGVFHSRANGSVEIGRTAGFWVLRKRDKGWDREVPLASPKGRRLKSGIAPLAPNDLGWVRFRREAGCGLLPLKREVVQVLGVAPWAPNMRTISGERNRFMVDD